MGQLTSTLTMRLVDNVSPHAKKLTERLKKIDAAVRKTVATGTKSFGSLDKSLAQSEVQVQRYARAWRPITTAAGPAVHLDRIAEAAGRAEAAVTRAGRAVRPLVSVAPRSRARTATAAAEHAAAPAGDRPGFHEPHAKMASTVAATQAAKTVAEHAAEAATAIERERIATDTAGLSPEEQKNVEAAAAELSRKFPSVSQSVLMHTLRNARAATGDLHHAMDIMEPFTKLRVLAQAKRPDADVAKEFDDFVRGMEMKGVTSDMKKFEHYMDGMAKAINIFGDTVTPSDYYQLYKFGRGATSGYSDEYMLKVAPTLTSEMGGSSAGAAGSAFHQAIIGRKLSQGALKDLAALGLLEDGKVTVGKGGRIVTQPGAVVGTDLARSDPYAWVNSVFLPALAKHGITEPEAIGDHIAAVFGNRMAQQIVTIFATQQQRIEKDRRNVSGAKGLEAADDYLARDPRTALAALHSQTENLLGNASSPLLPAATAALKGLATALGFLAGAAQKHPVAGTEGLLLGTAGAAWGSAEAARAAMHWLGFGGGGAAGSGFLARLAMLSRVAGPVGLGTLAFNAMLDGLLSADDAGKTHPYGPAGSAWDEQYRRNQAGNTDLIEARNRAEARRAWRDGELTDRYPDFGFHDRPPAPTMTPTMTPTLDVGALEAQARDAAAAVSRIFDNFRPVIHPVIDMPSIPTGGRRIRDELDGFHGDFGNSR